MQFIKMHGLGNDFVIMWQKELKRATDVARFAEQICHRRTGIGADGLILLTSCPDVDVQMQIYNLDGSTAEQCGNALRCVALYMHGLTSTKDLRIKSAVRVHHVCVKNKNAITVDMGPPNLESSSVLLAHESENPLSRDPVSNSGERELSRVVTIEDRTFSFTPVSMGNPHIVIEEPGLESLALRYWGSRLEHHPLFPNKVNVEFVNFVRKDLARVRVWERGAGETLACGSGACAVLVAGVLGGQLDREADIELAGGVLHIHWDAADGHVYMTGPAEVIFTGNLQMG